MQRLPVFMAIATLIAAPAAQAQSDLSARGSLLVQRHCAGCHAGKRTGQSRNPAAPPFRNLNDRYRIDDLGEALAEGILTGHPAMPEFKFQPRDVAAILSYIKSIQALQQATDSQRPTASGRRTLARNEIRCVEPSAEPAC
jgi:cytochrome c